MNVSTPKKRQKILNDTKVEIIKLKEETNKTDSEIADIFGIDRSTVTKIVKKKELYLNLENSDKKKSRIQKGSFFLVEEPLYQWYCAALKSDVHITHNLLKEKALFFYNKLKEDNELKTSFEASEGWIANFLNRYELNIKKSVSSNVFNDDNINYQGKIENESYENQSYDYTYNDSDSEDMNFDTSKAIDSSRTEDFNQTYQEDLLSQSENENMIQDAQAAKQALLLQKTLQQQLLQNQLAQVQTQQNQLALFKNPLNNSSLFNLIDPSAQVNMMTQPMQQTAQMSQENPSVAAKLDLINEKLDQIKQLSQTTQHNMPNMETQVVLQNIQRIVKENEKYKQELYEKSAKIEEQNSKITDLLLKAQNYVEQSHQYLELKNSSMQSTSEKSQYKILELEQDKMRLTSELTKLTSQISELNLEISKIKKEDLELKQQLNEVSKNTDQYKQNSERLLVENADLQTRLDTLITELKKERQLRKTHETKNESNEEEIGEMKSSLVQVQKLLEEKKKKSDSDRALFDQEMDELKKAHSLEINQLKDKLLKARSSLNDLQKDQIKQVEEDLNREWEIKLDKVIQQNEAKFNRKISDLSEENCVLKKQVDEASEKLRTTRSQSSSKENESEKLRHENEDLKVYKERYERLQAQALAMKDRYETRIKELLEAEPESEVVAEEVKKLMNIMYKIIKLQIKPEQYYSGNGILIAMLKIIKMVTLQLLDSKSDYEFDEENDFFSQFIYAPEPMTTNRETLVKEESKQAEQSEHFQVKEVKIEEKDAYESMDHEEDDQLKTSQMDQEVENDKQVEEANREKMEQNSDDQNTMVIQQTETNEVFVVDELETGKQVDKKVEENLEQDIDNLEDEEKVCEEQIGEKVEEKVDSEIGIFENEEKTVDKGQSKANSLFEESDEDEDLFSSKPAETKLFETEGESLQAEQKNEDKNKNETPSNNLAAAPANFKFSPPPLFDDDDDDNSEKDIDWFK